MISAEVTRDIEDEEQVDTELVGDDLYFVVFTQKPFGVTFGKSEEDKRNLFVTGIDESAAGYDENVIEGSYVAKLDKEVVEGLGAKKIFKIFKNKYGDKCPLKITFRKPEIAENVKDETPEAPAAPISPMIEEEEQEYDENAEYEEYDENDPNYEYYDEEEDAAE